MATGIYARVSRDSDEQEHALAQQLDRLRAAAKDDSVVEYIDVASGSRDDRPQLTQLMQDCNSGKLDAVICTRLDRISRSTSHGARLLEYFCGNDTPNLVALDDGLDLNTIGGRMVARMLLNLAQAETERLSERVIHGMDHKRQGLEPLGRAPYGYRKTQGGTNLELDPITAPIARAMVDRFLEVKLMRPVLREFERHGYDVFKSPHGFKNWLLNPALAGFRVYGKYHKFRNDKGKLCKSSRPDGQYGELHPSAHQALITTLERAKIKAIFADARFRRRSGLVKYRSNLLSGLVMCGHCQRMMGYQYGKANATVYMRCVTLNCTSKHYNRTRTDHIEDAIWDALRHQHQEQEQAIAKNNSNGWAQQEQELLGEIERLIKLNDPDYEDALQRKRERLQILIEEKNQAMQLKLGIAGLIEAWGGEQFWRHARHDQQLARQIFVRHVERVVVMNQRVAQVELRAS